jgi:hypothetical protein
MILATLSPPTKSTRCMSTLTDTHIPVLVPVHTHTPEPVAEEVDNPHTDPADSAEADTEVVSHATESDTAAVVVVVEEHIPSID